MFITDKYTTHLQEALKDWDIKNWDHVTIDSLDILIENLNNNDFLKQMYMYDSIVIASGLNDILEGSDGYAVFERMLKISSVLKVIETECHVLQLSPVSNTDKYTDTVIYNCQIEDEAGIIIIIITHQHPNKTGIPKSLLLQDDGVQLVNICVL